MFYSDDKEERELLNEMLLEWGKEIFDEVRKKRGKENSLEKTAFHCSVGKSRDINQYRPEIYEIIPDTLVA